MLFSVFFYAPSLADSHNIEPETKVISALDKNVYDIVIVDHSLTNAIEELTSIHKIPVTFSKYVNGKLTLNLPQGTVRELLDIISLREGLQWWYDGNSVRVTDRSETGSRLIRYKLGSSKLITDRLDALQISGYRNYLKIDKKLVFISGPSDLIALVELIIEDLNSEYSGDVKVMRWGVSQ